MNIGVLSERDSSENRVALTPAGAATLVHLGHTILIDSGAGSAARFGDDEYQQAGAWIVYDREEVIGRSDLVLKTSPIKPSEVALFEEGQVVLGFQHLAAAGRDLIEEMMQRGVTAVGYEVIENTRGDVPILHAMSEIAGQLSVHVGAHYLETRAGGRGILLGGASGIPPAHVVILGAGVVGEWAARTALGNGAQVTILDQDLGALRRVESLLGRVLVTEFADHRSVARASGYADLLIGAVLVKGERAPMLVSAPMVQAMKPGSVIVDVSIDQGGCVATSRPTRLEDPIFVESEVTHYAVPNMPSAVARTASLALSHASLPFLRSLADAGIEEALMRDRGLASGVYIYRGEVVRPGVARAFGTDLKSIGDLVRVRSGRAAR